MIRAPPCFHQHRRSTRAPSSPTTASMHSFSPLGVQRRWHLANALSTFASFCIRTGISQHGRIRGRRRGPGYSGSGDLVWNLFHLSLEEETKTREMEKGDHRVGMVGAAVALVAVRSFLGVGSAGGGATPNGEYSKHIEGKTMNTMKKERLFKEAELFVERERCVGGLLHIGETKRRGAVNKRKEEIRKMEMAAQAKKAAAKNLCEPRISQSHSPPPHPDVFEREEAASEVQAFQQRYRRRGHGWAAASAEEGKSYQSCFPARSTSHPAQELVPAPAEEGKDRQARFPAGGSSHHTNLYEQDHRQPHDTFLKLGGLGPQGHHREGLTRGRIREPWWTRRLLAWRQLFMSAAEGWWQLHVVGDTKGDRSHPCQYTAYMARKDGCAA
ncbi:hypothetical protein GQ43DRAFT_436161 [Delitschia confertaspora ATCC 74209]|uniref:Uncharacterized protein n=1 Tax=Delitschia confertaspora ATCC 74209 TaxID=1513339 RepID=A0A9P4JGV4_9PLEO|nr:hypothetical protein GQ43DRAFT_436161 [Delitschia confertaspora ATCC 74209]